MEALTTLVPGVPPLMWWTLVAAMVLTGLAGTVLPVLPGTLLVFGGLFVGAWIDGFVRVSGGTVALVGALALLAFATDYVAALLGAQRAGASRWALAGAALGTVLGLLAGIVGVLFLPFVGAVAGEWWAQRGRAPQRALEVGLATWLGLLVGTAVKLALVFVMIGVFAVALLW